MILQRQHFLLSYLKTLSVGPVGVSNSRPAASQPGAQPSEQPVRGANTVAINTSGKGTNALHMEKHALRVEKPTILQ